MPPRSTARKAAIVQEATVPDVASEIADAITTWAAAACQIAAGMHTNTPSDQRDFAGVLFADAQSRFKDVFRKMDPKLQQEFEEYVVKLCRAKR